MNRRDFLKGLVATSAGVLIPGDVDPTKKIYALDSTMIPRGRGERARLMVFDEAAHIAGQFPTKGWISRDPGACKIFSDEELNAPPLQWVISPEEVMILHPESYHSILVPQPFLRMPAPD